MVDTVVLREGQLGVAAVHAGAARVGQVLHLVVTAALQDVQGALDVGIDVRVRVGQRVAHACLGRQVDDPVGLLLGEDGLHAGLVLDGQPVAREAGLRLEARQAPP